MKNPKQSNAENLKLLKSGKYRNHYLIYTRKSRAEAESQKNSIGYQTDQNLRFSRRDDFPIASLSLAGFCRDGVVAERHSGFKEDGEIFFSRDGKVQYHIERPKFLQLIQFLNAGFFKGVICLCWDRISRNEGDDTVIKKLMRKGIDVRFALASYDKTSSGELHMSIDGMFARHHSTVTSEKVRLEMQKQRREGLCTHRAPIGYLNQGSAEHKPIDPDRGPIITEMFKLYATGDWSMSDLVRYARDKNMTTVPMRPRRTKEQLAADDEVVLEKISRPINKTHISVMLRNPFYTGKTWGEHGGWVDSNSHEPLVDIKTFRHVQEVLDGKQRVSLHNPKLNDHPMRGLVRCAECNRVYTPYRTKGILYFYVRCADSCSNTKRNFSFDEISEIARNFLSKMHFTDEEIETIESRTGTEIALLEERRAREIDGNENTRKRIREELAYLRSNRVSLLKAGVYTPEEFVTEVGKLEEEIDNIAASEEISEHAMREVMKDVIKLSELLKLTVPLYENANPTQKEEIARTVFSELFVSQNTLEYKLKPGFIAFADRFVLVCPPSNTLSELYGERQTIKANIKALKKCLTLQS